MRTTVALDDELVKTAQEYTGITERTALLREALRALIHLEASRQLAALGGTMPELEDIGARPLDRVHKVHLRAFNIVLGDLAHENHDRTSEDRNDLEQKPRTVDRHHLCHTPSRMSPAIFVCGYCSSCSFLKASRVRTCACNIRTSARNGLVACSKRVSSEFANC